MASKKKARAADVSPRPLTADDLKRVPWRSIGPAIMGGRVSDMCFEPGNPKTYYVAYATGGLWRTRNYGTTFEPIFDNEETAGIGAVACAHGPGEEGRGQVLWVGTGEGNGRNSSSWGCGVYRSVDGGKTWTNVGLRETHDIPRLAVDPRDSNVCYVAALGRLWGYNPERGVYKTSDGGATWVKVLEIDERTGACDVILDPSQPDTVYAAMYSRLRKPWMMVSGGETGGIYKSTDSGQTWRKLENGLPTQTGRIGLDIYLRDPQKLIAVVESTQDGGNSIRDDRMRGGGVFRSEDGGETWRRLSVRSPRAFYFSKVKFDPNDDQRVYLLGWTTEVSDDGGETFRGGVADLLHADHHAMLIDPEDSDHLIIGTDGGVSQSFDRGKKWDFLNTIAVGQFYNIALDDSDPYRIIGGLQDNGTWLGPSATNKEQKKDDGAGIPATGITNAEWINVFWGDGFHAAFDPTDPDTVYAEWQGGHITRIDIRTAEKRYISPEAREGEPRHRYNWNSPFLVSAHDPTVIYHAGNYVFKLLDRGDRWERISPDLTTQDPARMETVGSQAETFCTIVSLAESRFKKGLLWAGSDDGLIHVTKNDGKKWTNVTPKLVEGRYVSRIVASVHETNRAYVSIDGHRTDWYDPMILATDDLGDTWEEVTGDLPKGWSVKVVREDLFNPDVLYAGTEQGCFVSVNRGKNWVRMHGKGLPTTPVDDIQQHPRERDLVLGTHGRSIWILDGAGWLAELTPEVAAKPLHLFACAPAKRRWFLNYPGSWSHKMFRAANPPMGLRIDYWIAEYTGDDVEIVIEDAKGVVQKKLSGSNAVGYSRVVWDLQPDEWLRCADKGEDPWMPYLVRPGRYQVRITMGPHTETGEFDVVDP